MSDIYEKFLFSYLLKVIDKFTKLEFCKSYRFLTKMEFAERDLIVEYQKTALRSLLKHCYDNVPYYNKLFTELKINDFNEFTVSDLHSIPPLTKEIIRKEFNNLISQNSGNYKMKISYTGGSSGDPLKFIQDYSAYSMSWPANFRGWHFIDFSLGEKILVLGSSSLISKGKNIKKFILKKLFRLIPWPGINMSDDECEKIYQYVKKKKIKYIYGYASSIYIFALYYQKKSLNLKLKGIFPTSEVCPENYKKIFKSVFNAEVVDSYGARDGNISAFECKYNNFHLSEFSIPIIKGNSKSGPALITDLINYAFPFINYDLGDSFTLVDEICPCKRQQFLIKDISGRQLSIMRFSNGGILTNPGWTVLFAKLNVIKYKIEQTDIDSVKILIVPKPTYNKEEEENIIIKNFKKIGGENVNIIFEYFNDFPLLNSGKADYFIN